MTTKRLFFIIPIFNLFFVLNTFGQIQCTILDTKSNDPLIGVSIRYGKTKGLLSDINGKFYVENIQKNDTIFFSMVGYENQFVVSDNSKNNYTVFLKNIKNELLEVIIKGDKLSNLSTPSHLDLRKDILQKTYGLLEDPIQSIARMPGVGRVGDLFTPSRIYIRGGASDEILFLLDNTPVSWPWYFGGQKSIFNTDVIKNIELLTSGFSAAYGNYMSSVLNVSLKEGDFNAVHGSFSLGIYNAQAFIEAPIIKNKLSIICASRRTYMDKILKKASFPTPALFDTNLKLAYRVNQKNTITFANSISDESIDYQSKDSTGNGNLDKIISSGKKNTQSAIWQTNISQKMYNKLILTHNANKDNYQLNDETSIKTNSNIFGLRNDFTFFVAKNALIKSGFEFYKTDYTYTGFQKKSIDFSNPNEFTDLNQVFKINDKLNQIGAFMLYEGQITKKLSANVGLRWDSNLHSADISPRIRLIYSISKKSGFHLAWGKYHQFAGIGIQNANFLQSSLAIHYILGLKHRFNEIFSGWVEAYLKDYQGLAVQNTNSIYASDGVGKSKGIEFFIEKKLGKIQGWVSYALSNSMRTYGFDNKEYSANFDQKNIFNANVLWKIAAKNQDFIPNLIELNYRFETGRPYTPIKTD
jgi:hypothetical protein